MADNKSFRFRIGLRPQTGREGRTAFTVPVRGIQNMIYEVVGKARYDYNESCYLCLGFIGAGQFFVRSESKTAHYKCARKRGWKRKSRAKKHKPEIVREIASVNRPIKIIKHHQA